MGPVRGIAGKEEPDSRRERRPDPNFQPRNVNAEKSIKRADGNQNAAGGGSTPVKVHGLPLQTPVESGRFSVKSTALEMDLLRLAVNIACPWIKLEMGKVFQARPIAAPTNRYV